MHSTLYITDHNWPDMVCGTGMGGLGTVSVLGF